MKIYQRKKMAAEGFPLEYIKKKRETGGEIHL